MPMTEDMTVFFNDAELATKAVLDNVEATGIFDNAYNQALSGVGTVQPIYVMSTEAAARAKQGSALRIASGVHNGNRYRVAGVEPDGTGVTTLLLERA